MSLSFDRIEKLGEEYADQEVRVDPAVPELARFRGKVGRVVTINQNGRALVVFEGPDCGRYDIELDHLRVVDLPVEVDYPQPESTPENDLSALERARMEKEKAK